MAQIRITRIDYDETNKKAENETDTEENSKENKVEDEVDSKQSDPIFDQITDSIKYNLDKRNSSSSILSSATEEEIIQISDHYTNIPYDIQPRASYDHGQKNTDIIGVAYNGRMRQFILIDGRGITTWKRDAVNHRVSRALCFAKYQYRLFTHIIYVRKFNCYFVLTKDFSLKVLNRDFEETCTVSADLRCVLFMLYNPAKDELITGGVGGTKFWTFHQVSENVFNNLKPMANYRLTLKYELPEVGGSWVKRVELDSELGHLYCCSETDLNVYNFKGKVLFRFRKAHKQTITGCRYSQSAKVLVTSSIDCFVKVWSMTGGLVHTFRGHARAVTNLMIHPLNSSIIITSSLDGTIRMWSLETLEPLYSLVVSSEGILWMGLIDDEKLYICTSRHLTLWSLNYFYQYWSTARSKLTKMSLVGCQNKTTRILTVGDDNSVRLFARKSRKNLSTILPPPDLSPLEEISSLCYSREFNLAFLLIDKNESKTNEVWVYTTRTDPSCRIAVWNIRELQIPYMMKRHKVIDSNDNNGTSSGFYNKQEVNAVFRTTENGSGNETMTVCHCVCLLNSMLVMLSDEGEACPTRQTLLLLGMEDGRIFFMDPVIKGQKYMEFKASKDSIVQMSHDVVHNTLITMSKLKYLTQIHIWSLPNLYLQYEVYCPLDLVDYTRMNDLFVTGHESGCLNTYRLQPIIPADNGYYKLRSVPDYEEVVDIYKRPEHLESIICLDSSSSMKLFCSCSMEGAIKIWDEERYLLTEIMLDDSLSSALFLNNKADLVVGFKKHIFHIDHKHVCPHLKFDGEEDDFDQESIIYEDPAVKFEGIGSDPDPIDLNQYLIPYEIEFSKDFLEGKPLWESSSEEELELSDMESEYSMAPTEIYFSPPETPGKLANIDLIVGSEITRNELKAQMLSTMQQLYDRALEIPSDQETDERETKLMEQLRLAHMLRMRQGFAQNPRYKKKKKKEDNLLTSDGEDEEDRKSRWQFSFPKFGKSPGPSPTLSFLSTTPVLDSDDGSDVSYEEIVGEDGMIRKQKKPKKFKPIDAAEVSATNVKLNKPKSRYKGNYAEGESSGIGDVRLDVKALLKKVAAEEAAKKADHSHVRAEIDEHVSNVVRKQRDIQKKKVTKRKRPKQGQKVQVKTEKPKIEEKPIEKVEEEPEPSDVPESILEEEHLDSEPVTQVTLPNMTRKFDPEQRLVDGQIPNLPQVKDGPEKTEVERNYGTVPKKNMIEFFDMKKPGVGKSPTSELESETAGTIQDDTMIDKKMSVTSYGTLSNDEEIDDIAARIMMASPDQDEIMNISGENIEIKRGSPSSDAFDDDDDDECSLSRPESFMASSPTVTGKKLPFPSEFNYSDSDNDDDSIEEITVDIESRSRIYGATPDSGWVGDSEQTSISGRDERLGESRKDSMKINIDLDKSSKVKHRPVSSFVERRLYRDKIKPHQQIMSDAEIRDITEKEDLHIAFNEAYHRYQNLSSTPITPGNLHKNNDVKFDDNWHERSIERHMLLRMQKELRAHEAALKRKQRETEERNKNRLLLGLNDFDEDYQETGQYYQQPSTAHREIPLHYRHIRPTPHAPQTTPANSRPHTALPAFRRLTTHSDNSPAKHRPKTATSYHDRDPKIQEMQRHYSDRHLFNEGRELVGSVPRSPYDATPTHLKIYKDGDTSRMSRTQSSMSKKSHKSSRISRPQTGVDMTRYDQQEPSKTPSKIDSNTDKILKHMSHYQSEIFDDIDFEDRINTGFRFSKQEKDPVSNQNLQKPKRAIDCRQIDPRNSQAIRPKSSKSIPSKCSQYVLLSKPKEKSLYPLPTPLEEQLLAERFPMLGNKVYDHFEGIMVRHRKPEYNIDYSPFARELYG